MSTPCDQPILRFDEASLAYGGQAVAHDVSFSVGQSCIVGVVGESGSGKTTLLRSAFGPQSDNLRLMGGRVLYAGQSVWDMPARDLRDLRGPGLACVFQDGASSFCPVRRIGAQVWESVRAHEKISRRACDERLRAMLASLGLPDPDSILRAYPHELSGGMAQRVGIACALMLRPRVLLADEPTSALDAASQAQVIDALRRARDEHGCAVVLVTHDFSLVEALCDDAVVLHEGRVVEQGPARDLLTHPQAPYTRALVAAASVASGVQAGQTKPASASAAQITGPGDVATSQAGTPAAESTPQPASTVSAPLERASAALVLNGGHALAGGVTCQFSPATQISRVADFVCGAAFRAGVPAPEPTPQPSSVPAPLVDISHLGFSYGRGKSARPVLCDVSLQIAPGEIVGLVGESGCGKSTLARLIAGLARPTAGAISLALQASRPKRGPHKVQLVFQDPRSSFDPRRTLGFSVAEGLRNAGKPADEAALRVNELFARVGLASELAARYPHEVSGGQRQRAAIARALAAEPALLIADEATSALDVTVQVQVVALLRSLNAELGMAVLFITHDLPLAQTLCTRIINMTRADAGISPSAR